MGRQAGRQTDRQEEKTDTLTRLPAPLQHAASAGEGRGKAEVDTVHTWPVGKVGLPQAGGLNHSPVTKAVPAHILKPPADGAQSERHTVHALRDVNHTMTSYGD